MVRWSVALHPPPNLPLEGGRDELGRGGCWLGAVLGEILAGAGMAEEGGVGSCLRRNDGGGVQE